MTDQGLHNTSLKWVERGSGTGSHPHRCDWLMLGPLVIELWRWWLRLGISIGKWYIGFYLGPFVITLGLRRWRWKPRISRWTISAITVKKSA